eukprot:6626610-Pyramimonas_sp.AAC.1
MAPVVMGTAPQRGRGARQRGQEVAGEGGELTGRSNTSVSSSHRQTCCWARRKMLRRSRAN